ncbi:acyl carrier protein [Cohnella cholangitidis]|uniref:Acyl carrier protein n=2 Tax=Cohnella cholangitidis TaxID=2598458 RepID=A0A7G5BUG9_9BACL|nr:acyl carrier protein [Cohnella cholangitidis]
MQMDSIELKISEIVREMLKVHGNVNLTADQNLFDIGLDSLNAIQLIVRLEEEFDIIIDDDELIFDNFDSIEKIMEIMKNKQAV